MSLGLFLLIMPLMVSTVIRVFGWVVILGSEGLVNQALRLVGATDGVRLLVATIVGTLSAIGLVRLQFRGRQAIETFLLSLLLVPHILLGAAVYLYLARLAWPTSSWTLLAGHIVIATPYVIRCVTAGLVGMDPRLEEAAMSLGATRVQAFFRVTLPLRRSSLVTGAVFAFIISFSDINLALFLAGAVSPKG